MVAVALTFCGACFCAVRRDESLNNENGSYRGCAMATLSIGGGAEEMIWTGGSGSGSTGGCGATGAATFLLPVFTTSHAFSPTWKRSVPSSASTTAAGAGAGAGAGASDRTVTGAAAGTTNVRCGMLTRSMVRAGSLILLYLLYPGGDA